MLTTHSFVLCKEMAYSYLVVGLPRQCRQMRKTQYHQRRDDSHKFPLLDCTRMEQSIYYTSLHHLSFNQASLYQFLRRKIQIHINTSTQIIANTESDHPFQVPSLQRNPSTLPGVRPAGERALKVGHSVQLRGCRVLTRPRSHAGLGVIIHLRLRWIGPLHLNGRSIHGIFIRNDVHGKGFTSGCEGE